jgi:hypothetical protein
MRADSGSASGFGNSRGGVPRVSRLASIPQLFENRNKARVDESSIPFQESSDMLRCPTRFYAGRDTMTHANEPEASIHVEVW